MSCITCGLVVTRSVSRLEAFWELLQTCLESGVQGTLYSRTRKCFPGKRAQSRGNRGREPDVVLWRNPALPQGNLPRSNAIIEALDEGQALRALRSSVQQFKDSMTFLRWGGSFIRAHREADVSSLAAIDGRSDKTANPS
jgi:hypothetical protein